MRDYRNVLALLSSVLLPAGAASGRGLDEAGHARRSSPPAGISALAALLAGLVLVMGPAPRAMGQACEPEWAEGVFGVEGVHSTIAAFTVFDDGTGPALYAGGNFDTAGGVAANNIARWDGSAWTPLGDGLDDTVSALAVFDDGTGPALYAGGRFFEAGGETVRRIARWDGSAWTPLRSGATGQEGLFGNVEALAVFDDGSGPALYVGGWFERTASGMTVNYVARWDGSAWTPLGDGVSGSSGTTVRSLTVFDDGTGPALYAGGSFFTAGGATVRSIARWDGAAWTPLGDGFAGSSIYAMTVFDDGSGPALYAGGNFFASSGAIGNRIARWDGSAWTPLGDGVRDGDSTTRVDALAVFDDGTGPALYAGGDFKTAGGMPANNIARWDGTAWTQLGEGVSDGFGSQVQVLAVFDDGAGATLHAGGTFLTAGGENASHIATWDGAAWAPVGDAVNDRVFALTTFDDGTGPALYASGDFTSAGGVSANHIARWDDGVWTPLGEGLSDGGFAALTVFNDGSGDALYAGGSFTTAGGVEASSIARWDGAAWTPLGTGIGHFGRPTVHALTVFDDGTGPALYTGGNFTTAGGVAANYIARWDGVTWTPVGMGFDRGVLSLAVFDDGAGPALYAGGSFTTAGGVEVNGIARWDGSAWTPVGTGVRDPWGSGSVFALTVFDDGVAPALYAGGDFISAGGVSASRVARWDGSSWSPLGTGVWYGAQDVRALTVFDDGTGPALYAGGGFRRAGGLDVNHIARWDGAAWAPLGSGVLSPDGFSGRVWALEVFDDGGGPALFAGGDFSTAGGVGSGYMARWGCESVRCRADIDGDGELTFFDFLAFQDLFAAGDPRADFDGDGAFTFFDFLAFQSAFAAGCA